MLRRPSLVAVSLVLAAAACAGDDAPDAAPAADCAVATDGEVTLVAAAMAFDVACIEADAGPLRIVLENEDEGVNHNVHLPELPDSPATPLREGPARDVLEVTVAPGDLEFVCDLHPNMVGTIEVAGASPGP